MVLLRRANQEAIAFYDYLRSANAARVLRRYGFGEP
jgi:ABC-type molybdate transport system substrate-binding protein